MGRAAIDYDAAARVLFLLQDQMPRCGAPLDPATGGKVVESGPRVEALKNRVLTEAYAAGEAVKRVRARLEAEERGGGAAPAQAQ